MNKSQIADRLAGRMGLSRSAAADAVDVVFETIGEALAKHEEARIAGFGTFATKHRPARTGRNPRTGEAVSIPASVAPAFWAGKALKENVNGRRRARRRRNGWPRSGQGEALREAASGTGGRGALRGARRRRGLRRGHRPQPRGRARAPLGARIALGRRCRGLTALAAT